MSMHKADIARAYRDRYGMDMPTKKLYMHNIYKLEIFFHSKIELGGL
jgi:hypothetical protein